MCRDSKGQLHTTILHSKMESTFWPSQRACVRGMSSFLSDCKMYVNVTDVQDGWESTELGLKPPSVEWDIRASRCV
jgi:hypothetical protein